MAQSSPGAAVPPPALPGAPGDTPSSENDEWDDDDADSGGGDDWSAPAASPDARERGFDRDDDYSAEDDLCKGVRRMSTTPQKAPEPRAPFRHYSYRDADERPPAWQRKSAF